MLGRYEGELTESTTKRYSAMYIPLLSGFVCNPNLHPRPAANAEQTFYVKPPRVPRMNSLYSPMTIADIHHAPHLRIQNVCISALATIKPVVRRRQST